MDALDFAKAMLKRIDSKTINNHVTMDKGGAHDHYMKLVGANNQLREIRSWVGEQIQKMESDDGDV